MWLKELKIALVEKNINNINALLENPPALDSAQELQEVLFLLDAARSFIEELKDETQSSMVTMQKNINFLKSTQAPQKSKLDINS